MDEQLEWRHLENGLPIPSENYCDQPYIVVNEDGSWTCTMTTGVGSEGAGGQHIVATISLDRGRTWSPLIDIEPADGPEASWAVPLKLPSSRIYVFYTYNTDNLRSVKGDPAIFPDGECTRVDSLGAYAYKYSDDNGRTWCEERYEIPVRPFKIDERNAYGGKVRFFWGVAKPFVHDDKLYLGATKVGGFGNGFFTSNEGMLLMSSNLATELDPAEHLWETLPDGDYGLKAPFDDIAAEHVYTYMADGSLYCTYRTVEGYSCHAYSRDGGRNWTSPQYMTYTPGGRPVKNPRACNPVWRTRDGRFLYWFHFHGRPGLFEGREGRSRAYESRNPVWLLGGIERNGHIHWSEPEIVLYDDNPGVRISYPDLIEQDGQFYLSETQKEVARIHPLDRSLLDGMWQQGLNRSVAREGLVLELDSDACREGQIVAMPLLPSLYSRAPRVPGDGVPRRRGLTLELRMKFQNLVPGQVLFDSRDAEGKGMTVTLTDRETLRLTLCGRTYAEPGGRWSCGLCETSWETDRGLLDTQRAHQVAFIVDGGPKIISVVVDGKLCDGDEVRQYGWGRFPWNLRDVNGSARAILAPTLRGDLKILRLYDRQLRTAEAVANYYKDTDDQAP